MDLKYIENMKFNKEVFLKLQEFVSKDIESTNNFDCDDIECTKCPFCSQNRDSYKPCCYVGASDLRDIAEYYLEYFKGEMGVNYLAKVLVPGNIVEVSFSNGTHLGVVLNNSQVMYLDIIGFDIIPELLRDCENYYISRVFEPIECTTKESILQLEKLNCVYERNPMS